MLSLTGVGKRYSDDGQSSVALDNVTLSIQSGEYCALLGPSGSGKSTLLNILGLLDRPSSGVYQLGGVPVSDLSNEQAAGFRNASIGFVFQSFQLLPRLTLSQNVALPLLYRGIPKRARGPLATAMLARVGLRGMEDRRPDQLSGGQRQRVAIARALVGEPKLLLADEPTGNLDSVTAQEIMELFSELNRALGVTVVMVTHDTNLATSCKRQIQILDGRVVADSSMSTRDKIVAA